MSSVLCRPAAHADDAADAPTADMDRADGASTSEIMDMIEELVVEAGTSEEAVSLHHSHATLLGMWHACRDAHALCYGV